MLRTELIDFLQRALRSSREQSEGVGSLLPLLKQDNKTPPGGDGYSHAHSHSHRHTHLETHGHTQPFAMNINFLGSEKMASSNKKRYQTQV